MFVIWPWYGREASVDLLKLIIPSKYVCSALPDRKNPGLNRLAASGDTVVELLRHHDRSWSSGTNY